MRLCPAKPVAHVNEDFREFQRRSVPSWSKRLSPHNGGEPITNFGVARRTRDFLKLFAGSQQVELAAEPECGDLRRRRIRRHQGAEEDVGIEYQPHQSFSGTALKLPSRLLADARDGFVNKVLEFVRGHVGEGCAHLTDGLIQ